MTLSDDQSPAPPFYGDETGKVLEPPDVVWQSPTTTERVVDTQSGFLVVVREIGNRLALSVKRRLGTPPTSAILLTPDESLSLSKILSTPRGTTDGAIKARLYQLANDGQDDLGEDKLSSISSNQLSIPNFADSGIKRTSESTALGLRSANWEKLLGYKTDYPVLSQRTMRLILSLSILVLIAVGTMFYVYQWHSGKHAASTIKAAMTTQQAAIENFVRSYVTNMLDFNPASYQYSQIRAMASMTPDLMQKYWQETHFPITVNQLNKLFQKQAVVINKVAVEEPQQNWPKTVDIFGQMTSPKPQTNESTLLHLRLKIAEDKDKQLTVLEQTDLSGNGQ